MIRMRLFKIIPATMLSLCLSGQTPRAIKRVIPAYPPIARIAEKSGVVLVYLTIDAKGLVESATATGVNDHSINNRVNSLCPNALEAAKQWQFDQGLGRREMKLYFAYQLFPPGTDETHLQNEFIAPNIVLIKTAMLVTEHQTLH